MKLPTSLLFFLVSPLLTSAQEKDDPPRNCQKSILKVGEKLTRNTALCSNSDGMGKWRFGINDSRRLGLWEGSDDGKDWTLVNVFQKKADELTITEKGGGVRALLTLTDKTSDTLWQVNCKGLDDESSDTTKLVVDADKKGVVIFQQEENLWTVNKNGKATLADNCVYEKIDGETPTPDEDAQPEKCVGDYIEQGEKLEKDQAICAGKYRFGINAERRLGLWKNGKLQNTFKKKADELMVRTSSNAKRSDLSLKDKSSNTIWKLKCTGLSGKNPNLNFLGINSNNMNAIVRFRGDKETLWSVSDGGKATIEDDDCYYAKE